MSLGIKSQGYTTCPARLCVIFDTYFTLALTNFRHVPSSDPEVSRLFQYLVTESESEEMPIIDVAELKKSRGLGDNRIPAVINQFQPTKVFRLIGPERLQIDRIVLSYKPRLARCAFNDAL